jgi:hypothetical protein
MARLAILLLVSLVVVACSKPSPPAGRWMAHYESAGTMVDARLEIAANGLVRVSALDLTDIQVNSDEDRIALHGRLANDLSEGWGEVAPRPMDFDGKVFRKPGGFAHQMEWDPNTKQMKLVFYFGTQHSISIPMHPVDDFTSDPWAKPADTN